MLPQVFLQMINILRSAYFVQGLEKDWSTFLLHLSAFNGITTRLFSITKKCQEGDGHDQRHFGRK